MLANIAVVVLLLIPGELLLRRVDRAERKSDRAQQAAETAQAAADDTAQSLKSIQDGLIDRQYNEHAEMQGLYRRLGETATRESLIDALTRATADELISEQGVRAPVWWTNLHYRYRFAEGSLVVQLEDDRGNVLSTHPWPPETSEADFYQELVEAVRAAGGDLGVALNLPTQSIEELATMLVDVAGLRSQVPLGYRDTLRRVIERVDGWYFTDAHVIPANDLSYVIDIARLNEDMPGWEDHLSSKGWYEANRLIPFARRLYGMDAA
ncbi:hypothetical protein [Agromyces laixinhei]|uniref:hypothetical protein n=1 Tax=Agromyces laixinhei TaxID=2585717 RepID=UPI001117795A|nr:hypothetical protein [Agromyces laixinhei]